MAARDKLISDQQMPSPPEFANDASTAAASAAASDHHTEFVHDTSTVAHDDEDMPGSKCSHRVKLNRAERLERLW